MSWLGPNAWAYGVMAVMLIVAAVTDVRSGKIYNWTTYPVILIALVGHALMGGWLGTPAADGQSGTMGLLGAIIGLAVGFVPMRLARLAGGIGGGDAKAMAAVGALAGWRFALTSMFYGLAVAFVMAIVVLLVRRITKETFGRIGRYIWLLLMRAGPADPSTPQSPKIPIGLALCIGTAVALALVCIFGPSEKMFIIGL
jgi:prepilin peptidase CpaA